MVQEYLHKIGWFAGLALLQALVLNNMHLGGYAMTFLYVYLILRLESDTTRNVAMLWAFFLGLTVDLFSDTPGMNAAATVLLAFVRPFFLRLFLPRDAAEKFVPSLRAMGMASFSKYAVVCVLSHHAVLLALDYFSVAHVGLLLLRIVASAALTTCCILALEGIRSQKKQ